MKKQKISWSYYILELFVVFIGVSASFVLMNISDRNSEKEMEMKYLEGFKTDIQENIARLEDQISDDSTWISDNNYAVRDILDNKMSYDSACSLIKRMSSFSKFEQQNTTYLNVINSGSLGLIQDYNLRHEIISYYKDLDDSELLEEYFHGHNQRNFIPFMIKHFNMFTSQLTDREIYHGNDFKNLFGIHYSFTQQRLVNHKELLGQSKEVLDLVILDSE